MGLKPIFFWSFKMLLENTELIQTAESIAMEKGIEKELVFQAICLQLKLKMRMVIQL